MAANPSELPNPDKINYETKVKDILAGSDTHLSVSDIRVELTYRADNQINPTPEYGKKEIESDIAAVLKEDIIPSHENGELDLSREVIVYNNRGMKAEIEDTEERYRII